MRDTRAALAILLAQPIAHRGLHGCGTEPIENSLGAATAAVAAGYGIECDVQLSRDGEAIVFHDASLQRLTGSSGLVMDHDTAALRALLLSGGGNDHIPTLAEFLVAIDSRVPLVIELKAGQAFDLRLVDRTLALLDGYPGAVALESFDSRLVLHCRKKGTCRPIGLVGPPEGGERANPEALDACDFLSWSIEKLAEAVHLAPQLPRSTWTVRTPAQAALAAAHAAQVVFEGFTPTPSVNSAAEQ